MRYLFLLIFAILGLVSPFSSYAGNVNDASAVYSKYWEQTQREFDNSRKQLDSSLTLKLQQLQEEKLNRLVALKDKWQKAGNLDNVLILQEAIKNSTEEIKTDLPDVVNVYKWHREQVSAARNNHQTAVFQSASEIWQKLDQLKKDLTRKGDIESALEVKKVLEAYLQKTNELGIGDITAKPPVNKSSEKCEKCAGEGFIYFKCHSCNGTGQCGIANCEGGTQTIKQLGGSNKDPTRKVRCSFCKGTGKCQKCKGEGKIKSVCPVCRGRKN